MNSSTMSGSFYQSLTVKPSESEYDQISNRNSNKDFQNTSKETSPSCAEISEYDTIPTTVTILSAGQQSVITDNSLYASRGDTLKHPTLLKGSEQQLQYYQLAPVPESLYSVQDRSSSNSSSSYGNSCCKCSMNAMLFLLSILTILLSIMAITLVILIQFGVISPQLNSSSSSLSRQTGISINPTSSIPTTAVTSPSFSSLFLYPSSTPEPLPSCDCSTGSVNTTNYNNIYDSLLTMSEEIQILRENKNVSVIERMQLLSIYLTRIKSINESLQQLRPQANQPRHPNILNNHTVDIQFVMNDSCTVHQEISCHINDLNYLSTCITSAQSFFDQTTGLGIVDFRCNVTPPNEKSGSVQIITFENEISNTSNLTQDLQTASMSCRCYDFSDITTSCGYTVTRCPFKPITRTAQISVLT